MPKFREKILATSAVAGIGFCALAMSPQPRPSLILQRLLEALAERGPLIADKFQALFAFAAGAGLVLIVLLIILEILDRRRGGGGMGRRRRQSVLGTLFMFLALLIAYRLRPERPDQAAGSGPASMSAPAGRGRAPDSARPGGLDQETAADRRLTLLAATAGACAAGAFAAVYLARRSRDRPEPRSHLSEALARARRRLELGDSVRDAIIACYADMCDLFAEETASAPGRGRSLTAREFAELLRAKGAEEGEIAALTAAFEKARYSAEVCGEEDRDGAVAALLELERLYGEGIP